MKTINPIDNGRRIRTFTGKYIDAFAPDPDDICIEDIAHALSAIPRFNAQTKELYTVCQHSIMCCELVEYDYLRLEALLHDASEAYICDIPAPIKHHLPEYKNMEDGLMRAIASKFNFTYPLPEPVKIIDRSVLGYEWWVLVENDSQDIHPYSGTKNLSRQAAKARFLQLYEAYKRS